MIQILSTLRVLFVALFLIKETKGAGEGEESIVGTWSSKSNTVFTGPSFYDPVDELLIEPALPGVSFSFTEDGKWEQAEYQVSGNPKNHSCPTAALTFQHGTYETLDNGTLILTPIAVDGRQLVSDPCNDGGISSYNRYSQEITFIKHQVFVDPYHGRWRLNLYQWDGTPTQPLYLAYRPALMLPTETLNPTPDNHEAPTNTEEGQQEAAAAPTTSATSRSNTKRSLRKRIRRSLENRGRTRAVRKSSVNYELWWWVSVGLVALGSGVYFLS